MTTAVLIGLKRQQEAKSRLAPELSADERRRLMRTMLERVVAAAREADLGPVIIVSSDAGAAQLAGELGVGHQDDGGLPWNTGLAHGLAALDPQPDAVLYLAGDLPLVTAAELRALADAAPPRGMAIGRAHDGGTNALLLAPADALEPSFGEPTSSQVHLSRAVAAELEAVIVDLPGVALDVDTPEDARRAGVLQEQIPLGLPDQLAG